MKGFNHTSFKLTNNYRILFFVILLTSITLSGYASNNNADKKIYLVFRFDDYSEQSNTELELKIIESFRKNKLSFTVGVIPFEALGNLSDPSPQGNTPLGIEKGKILNDSYKEGVIEVALHGYSHQSHSPKYIKSEFKGLDNLSQKEKIEKGKTHLENMSGSKIKTFIPPWNQYDINTLKVLEEFQIFNLSADRLGAIENNTSVRLLPNSCSLLNVKDAVESARKSAEQEELIITLFHAYDFVEDRQNGILNFDYFSNLLNWVSEQKDVEVLTVEQMIEKLPDNYLKEKYWVNRDIIGYSLKLPPVIRGEAHNSYASNSYLNSLQLKTIYYYLAIFIISLVTTILITSRFMDKIRKSHLLLGILSFILLFLIGFYAIKNPGFGYNIATVLTLILGNLVAIVYLLISTKLKRIKS